MAMVNTPADKVVKNWAQMFVELGEIPPGFGIDQPGKFPLFGTSSWDAIKDQVKFKIREANKSGNTVLYQLAKTNYDALRNLREGLAARGILDSGEHNYQSAELTRAYANAQAAARAAAAASMQKGSSVNLGDISQSFAAQAQNLAGASQNAALLAAQQANPYSNPFFGSPLGSGGSVPPQIRSLFGG